MDINNRTNHSSDARGSIANRHDIETNPFVFLLKKTEKLASAVYLMTNHFSDNEPLKRSLRDKSSHLVSFMVGYKDLNGVQLHSFNKEIESRVIEIVSLLEISLNAGLISRMNFGIVQEEFVKLINTIKSVPTSTNSYPEIRAINEGYFNVGDYKSDQKRDHENYTSKTNHITTILDNKAGSNQSGPNKDFKKTDRQNTILSLIRKMGEINVKDVSDVIRNCSEKTIQRELLSLVSAGVIKRVGERRWSKYSMV